MSLPAMTFGDKFSTRGGMGEVGGCTQTAWPSLGSALEMPWLAPGGPLLSSCIYIYAQTGQENSPLTLHGTHFRQGSLYPSLGEQLPAECHDYCKLVNGWVWFESRTCRGWLQEHLCEVGGLKTQQNWGFMYGLKVTSTEK